MLKEKANNIGATHSRVFQFYIGDLNIGRLKKKEE